MKLLREMITLLRIWRRNSSLIINLLLLTRLEQVILRIKSLVELVL